MPSMAKRLFDIFFSASILFVGLLPMLALCFLVRRYIGRPVFFVQERPGKNTRSFKMVKFRTMTDERDSAGQLLPDKERITRLGQILRRTSLDELPEFWNVLKGDMSIVGPRPLLMRYLPRYTPEQARRHELKPGITGWAQINGRNAISWEDKFRYDVWYVDNQSFLLDIKILMGTILKVVRRADISAHGEATMPEFMGIEK